MFNAFPSISDSSRLQYDSIEHVADSPAKKKKSDLGYLKHAQQDHTLMFLKDFYILIPIFRD